MDKKQPDQEVRSGRLNRPWSSGKDNHGREEKKRNFWDARKDQSEDDKQTAQTRPSSGDSDSDERPLDRYHNEKGL